MRPSVGPHRRRLIARGRPHRVDPSRSESIRVDPSRAESIRSESCRSESLRVPPPAQAAHPRVGRGRHGAVGPTAGTGSGRPEEQGRAEAPLVGPLLTPTAVAPPPPRPNSPSPPLRLDSRYHHHLDYPLQMDRCLPNGGDTAQARPAAVCAVRIDYCYHYQV